MTGELITIGFKEDVLGIVEENGQYFVAMKPLCEALGLDWSRQLQILKDDPVLGSTMGNLPTFAKDGKEREMVCLPIHYLNGWLSKLDANRYEGERQAKIIRYQLECYQILHDHFFGVDRKQMAEFRKQLNDMASQAAEAKDLSAKAMAKVEAWERQNEQERHFQALQRSLSRAVLKMHWVNRLINYRTRNGLTHRECAKLLNVGHDMSRHWEARIRKAGLWPDVPEVPGTSKPGIRPGYLPTKQLTLAGVN